LAKRKKPEPFSTWDDLVATATATISEAMQGEAINQLWAQILGEVKPPAKLKPSDWMERHFCIVDGDVTGYIRFDRGYEFQREFIDVAFGDFKPGEAIRDVVAMKGGQSGITQGCRGGLLYQNVEKRISVAHMMPRQSDAINKAKECGKNIKADSMLNSVYLDSPACNRETIHGQQYRHVYSNSEQELVNWQSGASVVDETDRCETDAFNSISMFWQRMGAYRRRIRVMIGTPKLPESGIHAAWLKSDQRAWVVTCPFCQHEQALSFDDNIRWDDDLESDELKAASAQFCCCSCENPWDTRTREIANSTGKWVPQKESPIIGFTMNRLMVPSANPQVLVENYLSGLLNDGKMREHFNQDRGLPFIAATGKLTLDQVALYIDESVKWGAVPEDSVKVTCGIDVQGLTPPFDCVWEFRSYDKDGVRTVFDYGIGKQDDLEFVASKYKVHAGLADISSGYHKQFVMDLCDTLTWCKPARFDSKKQTSFDEGGKVHKVKKGHDGYALNVDEVLDLNMSCFYLFDENAPTRIKIAPNPSQSAEKEWMQHYTRLYRNKGRTGPHGTDYFYEKQLQEGVDYPYAGAMADFCHKVRKSDLPQGTGEGLGSIKKPFLKQQQQQQKKSPMKAKKKAPKGVIFVQPKSKRGSGRKSRKGW
jgi:hypothetical protein